jgi:hypothetical protein
MKTQTVLDCVPRHETACWDCWSNDPELSMHLDGYKCPKCFCAGHINVPASVDVLGQPYKVCRNCAEVWFKVGHVSFFPCAPSPPSVCPVFPDPFRPRTNEAASAYFVRWLMLMLPVWQKFADKGGSGERLRIYFEVGKGLRLDVLVVWGTLALHFEGDENNGHGDRGPAHECRRSLKAVHYV